ncbi:MAG: protein phosphatase 2C domain-containing protein [Nitrospinae bacterium]|nr:protein phosphatase 2C domain-containing protein [Nitrospinota bacterium]
MHTNHLFAEVLFAGGRRHGLREDELCEDAAGIHFLDGGAIFFLADGTSDEAGIGPFSSRCLANSLGYYFIESCLENHFFDNNGRRSPKKIVDEDQASFPPPSPLLRRLTMEEGADKASSADSVPPLQIVSIFNDAWKRLSQAWEKEFGFFIAKEENREQARKALAPYNDPKNNKSGHLLNFSATFCAGVLGHKGRSLDLVKIGDIDVAIKTKENSMRRLNSHRERLFVQLISCDKKEEMKLVFPAPKYKERSYEDVEFVVAKSDGVKLINDDLSFNLLSGGKKENLLRFRKLLTKGYDKNIGDDKAILYLMYME